MAEFKFGWALYYFMAEFQFGWALYYFMVEFQFGWALYYFMAEFQFGDEIVQCSADVKQLYRIYSIPTRDKHQ